MPSRNSSTCEANVFPVRWFARSTPARWHTRCIERTDTTYQGIAAMPKAWSGKRERQYEHIKESYKDRGVGTDEAEERAARTVNKERREHGETKSSKKR